MSRRFLEAFGFALLIIMLSVLYIDYKTSNVSDSVLSNLESKVWAHAGFYKNTNFKKNSIGSFQNALLNNAKGTEMDVFYDEEIKNFVVSHDYPYSLHDGNILLLDSVFKTFGNKFKYWLDFKNLKDLKRKDVEDSKLLFDSLLKKNKINKQHILLESIGLQNLKYYTKNGFYTSYWITPYKSRFRSILRDYILKLRFVKGEYSSLSMQYNYYKRIENSMNNIPINLFTVNDKILLQEYLDNEKIKIIITDNNWFLKK